MRRTLTSLTLAALALLVTAPALAQVRLPELDAATTPLGDADLFLVRQDGETRDEKVTWANVRSSLQSALTLVLGPASVCADNQLARWDGASNTALQCSPLVVADTTGDITAPGALTIATAAGDGDITLAPHGTGEINVNASLVMASGKQIRPVPGALDGIWWAPNTMLYGGDYGGGLIGWYDGARWLFHVSRSEGAEANPAFSIAPHGSFGWDSGLLTQDTALKRVAAGVVGIATSRSSYNLFDGSLKAASYIVGATYGALASDSYSTELLTLDTGGTTTATAANLAPANATIEAILYRVTTAVTGACTEFTVGVTGGNAFVSIGTATTKQGTVTEGTTGVLVPNLHADQYNATATTLTVTCNGTPTAGAVRLTTITRTFTPATS